MENINEIIDNICNRLGTTVDFIVPEYIRMEIISKVAAILICIIISVLLRFICKKLDKLREADCNYEELYICSVYANIIISIFLLIGILFSIADLAKALVSPYGYFVSELIRMSTN